MAHTPNEERKPMSRRQLLRLLGTGVGASVVLAACGNTNAPTPSNSGGDTSSSGGSTSAPAQGSSSRPFTPTFYQWIEDLHPSIPEVNAKFPGMNYQIAPVEGFSIERFAAEAKNKESTWDVYVGMTPFIEMTQLVQAGIIEPWDNYIPKEIIDDIIPSIREECSIDGKLYNWPFVLDVTGLGWNNAHTEKAGITEAPKTWDELLANSKKIQEAGIATYGASFDSHGWRSLVPFAHSYSTKVYDAEGLFDFTSEGAIEALKLMKQLMEVSSPDVLLEGVTDGGVNGTPDEVTFAAQKATYIPKYFNTPLRMAANWSDPSQLRMAGLPKFANGEGSTVFWSTGACLFTYGQNKETAVEYMKTLTYDAKIWQDSIAGTPTAHPGQLPAYKSLYAEWDANPPSWMQPFVSLVRDQLEIAKAIPSHAFGLQQFVIAKPYWETYLKGEESDPMKAMQAAKDAVAAEIKRAS